MNLADHGVACHAAEASGDLTSAEPLGPELLQELNPFVVPGHKSVLLKACAFRARDPDRQAREMRAGGQHAGDEHTPDVSRTTPTRDAN
jgi:hypothetical protein